MKFMMFVCSDSEPDEDKSDDIERWVADVDGNGRRVLGSALAAPESATTVRVRRGELLLSDGPFTETKEVIVGFDILECEHLDEAIEIARAHPMARLGQLELRPFLDLDHASDD
ncbi:YciI family protein [Actinomadura litoris]|uniref:YciI family protein n=1 Tax=Actinomadura litoris TaxID=2678616 RepID=UPI001FA78738|nr:YciI family protein [Actinomadura litoris]